MTFGAFVCGAILLTNPRPLAHKTNALTTELHGLYVQSRTRVWLQQKDKGTIVSVFFACFYMTKLCYLNNMRPVSQSASTGPITENELAWRELSEHPLVPPPQPPSNNASLSPVVGLPSSLSMHVLLDSTTHSSFLPVGHAV